MPIDYIAIALDRVDNVWRRPPTFIGDCRIERRKIDRSYRLRAEHERIETQTLAIDLRFLRQLAESIEAGLGSLFDAALEQMYGRQIAGVFQRAAQRERSTSAAVVVLRRPEIF